MGEQLSGEANTLRAKTEVLKFFHWRQTKSLRSFTGQCLISGCRYAESVSSIWSTSFWSETFMEKDKLTVGSHSIHVASSICPSIHPSIYLSSGTTYTLLGSGGGGMQLIQGLWTGCQFITGLSLIPRSSNTNTVGERLRSSASKGPQYLTTGE